MLDNSICSYFKRKKIELRVSSSKLCIRWKQYTEMVNAMNGPSKLPDHCSSGFLFSFGNDPSTWRLQVRILNWDLQFQDILRNAFTPSTILLIFAWIYLCDVHFIWNKIARAWWKLSTRYHGFLCCSRFVHSRAPNSEMILGQQFLHKCHSILINTEMKKWNKSIISNTK